MLRPGGALHVFEHGLAPDAGVATWQHRLEPLQKRVFGGCHLTRDVPGLLTDAGFRLDEDDASLPRGPAADASVELRPPGPGQRARLRLSPVSGGASPWRRRRG